MMRPVNRLLVLVCERKWQDSEIMKIISEIAPPTFSVDTSVLTDINLDAYAAKFPDAVATLLGDEPLQQLFNLPSSDTWRGSQLEFRGLRCLPTLDGERLQRDWAVRPIIRRDIARAIQWPESRNPTRRVRPTFTEAYAYIDQLHSRCENSDIPIPVVCDIETRSGQLVCIGFATSSIDALCIPFRTVSGNGFYWSSDDELLLVWKLRQLFNHPKCYLVGQNFLYDAQYLARWWGVVPSIAYDTLIAQSVLFPGVPKALDFLASMYCHHYVYWKEDSKDWDPHLGEEQLWRYNCDDCVRTFEVYEVTKQLISSAGLENPFAFQMDLTNAVLQMMLEGVTINDSTRQSMESALSTVEAELKQFFHDILGHEFNPKSPKQMHALFYSDFACIPVKDRKTGKPTLNDDALGKLARKYPLLRQLCNAISDYRSVGVFRSNFLKSKTDIDGKLRSSFNPAGTETFRFSSSTNAFGSGLNFQNIPTEGSKSGNKAALRGSTLKLPNVREIFIPDETDQLFWNADLDRADLQVVVWEANDDELKTILREGIDLHLANAQTLFGLPYCLDDLRDPATLDRIKRAYKPQREFCKTFIHGTNYGGKPRTMAENSRCSVAEAEEFQSRWFGAHPGILEWHVRTQNNLNRDRTVHNAFGYRRVYFDRVESILPAALAWQPQSTVACVINRGLVAIRNAMPNLHVRPGRTPGASVRIQVHDSLAGLARIAEWPQAQSQILELMKIVIPYADPLVIPASLKSSTISWGHCE